MIELSTVNYEKNERFSCILSFIVQEQSWSNGINGGNGNIER